MTKLSIIVKALVVLTLVNIGTIVGSPAQTIPASSTSIFRGIITDQQSKEISGASILIETNDRRWTVSSDENGEFKIALPAGTFSFLVAKDSFKKLHLIGVVIKEGEQVNLRFPELERCGECLSGDPGLAGDNEPIKFDPATALINNLPILRLVPQSAPNIGVNGSLSASNVKRGRSVQGTITMDIPAGYHVNSSRPLEKFLVATQLQIEGPNGIRVGPVIYPRAVLRTFKFSKSKVSVYEGRAVMRFNISVPAGAATGASVLKARLRYQSCNNELCFPPQSREVNLSLTIN
jgi:hypothetical protein